MGRMIGHREADHKMTHILYIVASCCLDSLTYTATIIHGWGALLTRVAMLSICTASESVCGMQQLGCLVVQKGR